MSTNDWPQIKELLAGALARAPGERSEYLHAACGGDKALEARVEDLLELDDPAASFFEPPTASALIEEDETAVRGIAGRKIGGYELRRTIAAGGMGVVYEAAQDHPHRLVALKILRHGAASRQAMKRFQHESAAQDHPHRLVALKILRHGAASRQAMKRFQHESEILGRLQHPNIAQIYDAGTHDEGEGAQPYFAMQLVKGSPLIDYCDSEKLATRDRLALFAKVCDAVQYAHHKGVIHRDLKPDNVLVDDFGEPKILDFGVARATGSDIQVTTLRTDIGQLIGTVPYMSPEQVSGDPGDLDTRSDVYSLGVVLYELMCGRLPHELRQKSIPEAARVIREDDPTPLSSVNKTLRGDVETIVAKALEKEKERRYQTAAELAADVRRYLSDEPIVARPASTFYQLRKFARRNKVVVGAAGVVFVVLVGAIITTSLALVRAVDAEVDAKPEAATSQQVAGFIQEMLGGVDPFAEGKDTALLKQILDEASGRVEVELADQPEVEAAIRNTIGRTYGALGEYAAAEPHLERALEIRLRVLGKEDPKTLQSMAGLARLYSNQDRFEESERLYLETLEIRSRVLGEEHPDTLASMAGLAWLYHNHSRYPEAITLAGNALEIQERILGEEHRATLATMDTLASALLKRGRFAEAEELAGRALELRTRVLGAEHPDTLNSKRRLAGVFASQGRYGEAERLLREVLEVSTRVLTEEHKNTLWVMHALARLWWFQGRYDEAETLHSQALEIRRRILGPRHKDTLRGMYNVALVYTDQGRYDEAERLHKEVLELSRGTGEDDVGIA
ncbi:MAG: serine/threonine protein kinase, partial [Planctomycetota bacterium]